MKLVSFQVRTPVGSFVRAGALHGKTIVDLNMAYARVLADQKEAQPYRLAKAMAPPTMLELLEGGDSAMGAARQGFDHAGCCRETIPGTGGANNPDQPGNIPTLRPPPESASF